MGLRKDLSESSNGKGVVEDSIQNEDHEVTKHILIYAW